MSRAFQKATDYTIKEVDALITASRATMGDLNLSGLGMTDVLTQVLDEVDDKLAEVQALKTASLNGNSAKTRCINLLTEIRRFRKDKIYLEDDAGITEEFFAEFSKELQNKHMARRPTGIVLHTTMKLMVLFVKLHELIADYKDVRGVWYRVRDNYDQITRDKMYTKVHDELVPKVDELKVLVTNLVTKIAETWVPPNAPEAVAISTPPPLLHSYVFKIAAEKMMMNDFTIEGLFFAAETVIRNQFEFVDAVGPMLMWVRFPAEITGIKRALEENDKEQAIKLFKAIYKL